MTSVTTKLESSQPQNETAVHLFDNWIDPIETEIRGRVRGFIEELIREELDAALARPRYGRQAKSDDEADGAAGIVGHRHGSRTRTLMGTFGTPPGDVFTDSNRPVDGPTGAARGRVTYTSTRCGRLMTSWPAVAGSVARSVRTSSRTTCRRASGIAAT